MSLLGATYDQLHLKYLSLGGEGTQEQLERSVVDGVPEGADHDHEHNVIAAALNETFFERGMNHPVAYRNLYRPEYD